MKWVPLSRRIIKVCPSGTAPIGGNKKKITRDQMTPPRTRTNSTSRILVRFVIFDYVRPNCAVWTGPRSETLHSRLSPSEFLPRLHHKVPAMSLRLISSPARPNDLNGQVLGDGACSRFN